MIAVFGVLVALAGIEHGVGEVLQGTAAPDGIMIRSWPDNAAFEILDGEPAMTIVPNLLVTGVLAIVTSVALGAWAATSMGRRHASAVLLGLSGLLLLVGGGLAPPLMGAILAVAAARRTSAPRRRPGAPGRAFARLWPGFTVVGVAAYLALVPGIVLLEAFGAVGSEALVLTLAATAYGGLLLSLASALVADRC